MDSKQSAWGSSGYTSTSDFKVGKTSSGTIYKGRLTFGPLPTGIVITSIKLTMNRIDSYNTHTIKVGASSSGTWGSSTSSNVNWTVGSGRGNKSVTLTSMAEVISGYTSSNWYLHITHGSGTNSYTEFSGGSNPTITITYEYASSRPTFSASSVTMGNAVTIYTNRKSDALTHTIQYSFGSASGTIGSEKGVGDSVSWTPPVNLAAQIPRNTSGSAVITCITYLNGTETGRTSATLTLNVPTTVVPSISSVNISEAVSGLAAKFGAYIQNKSKLKIVVSASGAQGSSISSYSVNVGGAVYSGSSITTNTLSFSGSVAISVTVTDTRGRKASRNTSVNVSAYAAPYIAAFNAARCNSAGTAAQANGTRVWVTVQAGSYQMNGKNTTTVKIQYKTTSSSTWIDAATLSTTVSGINYVVNKTNYALPESIVFNATTAYDLRVTVSDYFATSSVSYRIPGSAGLAYWDPDRNRIGFGIEASSNNSVQINPDWKFSAGSGVFSGALVLNSTTTARQRIMVDKNDGVMATMSTGAEPPTASFYLSINGQWTNSLDLREDRTISIKKIVAPGAEFSNSVNINSPSGASFTVGDYGNSNYAQIRVDQKTDAGNARLYQYIDSRGTNGALSFRLNDVAQNAIFLNTDNTSLLKPLTVASGGTGATTAAQARINLGIPIKEVMVGTISNASSSNTQISFGRTFSAVPVVFCVMNGGTDFVGYKVTGITTTGFYFQPGAGGTSWRYLAMVI